MDNRIYGYARVSTREQNEDRQLEALTKFGVPEQNIIIDKASGKDTEREGYQYLKRRYSGREIRLLSKNWTDSAVTSLTSNASLSSSKKWEFG